MEITGHLRKMKVQATEPVSYALVLDDTETALNEHIGKNISLTHTGKIQCIHCGRATKKSFSQGYCYPCFRSLPQCDMCIMSPERCHYHEGTCRDASWGETHCMQPHHVYLANSSGVKVGITREKTISTRWIDQGAVAGMPIAKVASRQMAGFLEVALKKHITDKTQWQRMLKGDVPDVDLATHWQELKPLVADEVMDLQRAHGDDAVEMLTDQTAQALNFPLAEPPTKVKSLNMDKTPEITGILHGIKGQYLVFEHGVINVRKYTGYEVTFAVT